MERPPPSPEALAESRNRLQIPDNWGWHWCINPACDEFVWCEPLPKAQGLWCAVVCSPTCALEAIAKGVKP